MLVLQYMTAAAAAAAAAPMQGTYIPQYTPVPPTAVPVEVSASNPHASLTDEKQCVRLPNGEHHYCRQPDRSRPRAPGPAVL